MLASLMVVLTLSFAPPGGEGEAASAPLKAGAAVVFVPGTYRKAEIHYAGADPLVRFTVEDPAEFRQMEDTALRPVALTKKKPRLRLPSGYLTTAVPVYTAGRVLDLKAAGSEYRNITPIARVELQGGPLGGKTVWVRQSALEPQETGLDSPLRRGFADWARANREAEEASGKLPPGNRLRKTLGRVKEVEAAIRARPEFTDADVDAFLHRAVRDRWPTYSTADFTYAAYTLRPSSQAP